MLVVSWNMCSALVSHHAQASWKHRCAFMPLTLHLAWNVSRASDLSLMAALWCLMRRSCCQCGVMCMCPMWMKPDFDFGMHTLRVWIAAAQCRHAAVVRPRFPNPPWRRRKKTAQLEIMLPPPLANQQEWKHLSVVIFSLCQTSMRQIHLVLLADWLVPALTVAMPEQHFSQVHMVTVASARFVHMHVPMDIFRIWPWLQTFINTNTSLPLRLVKPILFY